MILCYSKGNCLSVQHEENKLVRKLIQGSFVVVIFTKPKENWRRAIIKQPQNLIYFLLWGQIYLYQRQRIFVVALKQRPAFENRKERNSCLMLRKWGKMSQSAIPLCGHWSVGSDSSSVLNHPGVRSQPVLPTPFFRPAPKIMESVLRQECHGAPISPLAFFF